MESALRPLTTGELLDRTFQMYRQNFALFAGISSVPYLLLLVLQLIFAAALYVNRTPTVATAATAGLSSLVLGFAALIATSVCTAASTFAVSDLYLNRSSSIAACFSRVRGKLLRVIYTSIELGLRVVVGFLLLIVPGIYWAGMFGIAVPVVVLEDVRRRDVFKRSAQLTKGFRGRVIAVYFITAFLVGVVRIAVTAILVLSGIRAARNGGVAAVTPLGYVLNAVVNAVVGPVMAIALTLVYYDQRVRKEAFDIETMVNLLKASAAPGLTAGAAPKI